MDAHWPNPESVPETEILRALGAGDRVIVPNQALVRYFQHRHAAHICDAVAGAWPSPRVISWPAWMLQAWNRCVLAEPAAVLPGVLSRSQESWLWRQAVQEVCSGRPDARTLQDAWALEHDWLLERAVPDSREDVQQYRRAAGCMVQQLKQRQVITAAQLPAELVKQVARLSGEGTVWLVGFTRMPPAQRKLVDAMRQSGLTVREVHVAHEPGDARLLNVPDAGEEVARAAAWVHRQLAHDPRQSIALVCPTPAETRPELELALDRLLCPAAWLPRSASYSGWAGAGQPALPDEPVIRIALQVLTVPEGGETTASLMRLLLSPFLRASSRNPGAGARTDRMLRERAVTPCTLPEVVQIAAHPVFRDVLKARQGLAAQQQRAWSDWAAAFSRALRTAGWARDVLLSEREARAVQQWSEALDTLASLDRVAGPVPRGEALRELRRVLAAASISGGTDTASVQILGIADAAGQRFDQAWVLGMHDGAWPPAQRLNPCIPYRQQREQAVPGGSPEEDTRRARMITQQLQQLAPTVIFSAPVREEDRPLTVSPLIRHLPSADESQFGASGGADWVARQRAQAPAMESFRDDHAPSLPPGLYSGGTGILEKQACCPFRAFAETRLRAEALGAPEPGIDAATRGSLAHGVLEHFWRETPGSAALAAMDEVELGERLQRCVEKALVKAEDDRGMPWRAGFRSLEAARLQQLARDAIDLERGRDTFSVRSVESRCEVQIDGLACRVTLDRVDETADGAPVVIDYKTGTVSKSRWSGERLEAPQLPLYTLALEAPPQAIAFMRLKKGDIKYDGVGAASQLLPGVGAWNDRKNSAFSDFETWEELLGHWRQSLSRVANEYLAGEASVLPISRQRNCAYCALHPLCRIHQNPVQRDDTEESGE